MSAVLLAAGGGLFVAKYGARVSPLAIPVGAAFPVVYVSSLSAVRGLARRLPARGAARAANGVAVLFLLVGAGLAVAGPETTRVARAPAIEEWLGAMARGAYPYCRPMRPSGLPGLFFLAAPFWAADALALIPLVGLGLFLVFAWRWVPRPADRLVVVAALAGLPQVYYEVLVRSELFANVTLTLGVLLLAERALRRGGGWAWVAAAAAGLVGATRLVAPLVFSVYVAFAYRRAPARVVGATLGAALVFAGLVAPFVAWDPTGFATCGPLAIQGLYLPPAAVVGIGGAALALGWTAGGLRDVGFRAGVLVSAAVAVSFGLAAARYGLSGAVEGGFDLGYFVLPTPLLALALAERWREGD